MKRLKNWDSNEEDEEGKEERDKEEKWVSLAFGSYKRKMMKYEVGTLFRTDLSCFECFRNERTMHMIFEDME